MSPNTIFYLITGIVVFNFIFEKTLDIINSRYSKPELPEKLKPYYDADKYSRSIQYHKEHERLGLWSGLISFAAILGMLIFNGFAWVSGLLEPYIANPVVLALIFFGVLSVASGILSLPFDIYGTFVIEQKYGFNKTTPATYIIDKLKGILIGVVLGGGLGFLFLWLIIKLGPDFWLYAWALTIVITFLLNIFYTSLIIPIFNKLTPLPSGELRDKIEAYARRVNFPLTNIMVINGSKRSSKANAFFSGMGRSKKIVLYDTLIEKHSQEELVSILAHEVGHYKKKHIIVSMVLSWLQMGFTLWLLSRFIFSENLSLALGASHQEIHINLIAFGILYEPISMAMGILMNMLSRKNEYEADQYAVTTADKPAFSQALIRLSTDNLSNLTPHPAYVFFHYSHPTLLQRLGAINRA